MNSPWTRNDDGTYTAEASEVRGLLLTDRIDDRAFILPNGINLMRMDRVAIRDAENDVTHWQYRRTDDKRTLVATMFND